MEVETSQGSKAVAGAAILGDICMEKMNATNRAKLLFVFYRSRSNIKLAEKRLLPLKSRIECVEILPPTRESGAMARLG